MDDSVHRNLDTQHRLLADLERGLDAALDPGIDADLTAPPVVCSARTRDYDALTAANDAVRDRQGWTDVDLDAALTPGQRDRFEQWMEGHRLSWTPEDFLVLGFAGIVGAAATIFDTQLDDTVRTALGWLKDTPLIEGWEADARRLPIDYTGKGVGGPSHRIKSAGHDLARPLEALRQIREGVFRGTAWPHDVKTPVVEQLASWQQVDSWPEAMIVWAKHLAADVVTPMSLPLPGMTKLYELDNSEIRRFAHDAYQGQRPLGHGLNTRSGALTPTLAVLSTEAIIRTHVMMRAHQTRGNWTLTPAERVLQTEMLLAGHGLVGGVALGKSLAVLMLTDNPALAIRHLSMPVLMRVAALSLSAVRDGHHRRVLATPSWDDLLQQWAQPWQLHAALDVDTEARRLLTKTLA